MKKSFLAVLLLLMIGLLVSCSSRNVSEYESFDIKEYENFIEDFKTNGKVNSINNTNDAKIASKAIWKETFDNIGFEDFFNTDLFCEYSYHFDENSDIWLIHRQVDLFDFGSGMNAVINQNGDVIAVWRDK